MTTRASSHHCRNAFKAALQKALRSAEVDRVNASLARDPSGIPVWIITVTRESVGTTVYHVALPAGYAPYSQAALTELITRLSDAFRTSVGGQWSA